MPNLMLLMADRLKRRLRAEGGFTLIELMISVGVILTALLALLYTATIGFTDIAFARQRQGANGLANQAIEQARALPFDTLAKGMSNADLIASTTVGNAAYDANIVLNGSCGAPIVYCYNGERIPQGGASVVPLVPHQTTTVIGATTYKVFTYVTYYNNITTANTYRLSSLVTWANPVRKGVLAKVQSQTLVYSASGCLSTQTHPFAAPCQPFFYANALANDGHVDVTGTIQGIDTFSSGSVLMPQASSNLQVEQIAAVQGISLASGTSLTMTGSAATTTGRELKASSADNDPAQPGQGYSTLTMSGAGGVQTANGGGASLQLNPSTGDSGTSTSTTSASIAPAQPCPLTGISQSDLQPCGSSQALQAGATSIILSAQHGAKSGTSTLFSMAAGPVAQSAFTNRDIQANLDGLAHADVSKSLGTVTVGGLPSDIDPSVIPAGWAGYLIQLTGASNTVSAETGTNSAAPTATAAGSLRIWNGAGYTTVPIVAGASIQLAIPTVNITDNTGPKTLTVKLQARAIGDCNVWAIGCPATGGTSVSSTILACTPLPCPNTRTKATATAGSPLAGDIHYTVTYDGVVIANVTVHIDLGTLLAQNTYQVAPSA
jgi:type II secretory pathway pseudopilin PulG